MSETIVSIEGLTKTYGSVLALEDVSLEVARGRIIGLLGPNGAGKTTTVKVVTTLVQPDRGKVDVAGIDLLRDPEKVRRLIGYVPQELTVDPYLTAREHLRYYGDIYHLSAGEREVRVRELLAVVGLEGYEDRRVRTFSGGMKKKLDLICGLIHQPVLILLDEPSLGLDVNVRRDVWSYISRLRERGTTVFLCTNYMDEAEQLCDEVAIIDRGKVVATGTPAGLCRELRRDVVSIEIAHSMDGRREGMETLENAVSGLGLVKGTVKEGRQLKIYVESDETALPQILQAASSSAVPIQSVTHSRPGLDEVFLHYTGHAFADGENGRG